MQTILKKCPFTGTGKLSKLFDIVLRGNEQASRVSDPSKKISAGSHKDMQHGHGNATLVLRGLIPF
jgi:hypothetical protein